MFQFLPFFNKYVKFSGLYSSQDSNQTRTVIQTIRYMQAFFVCIQNKQAWKSFSDYDLAIKNFTKKFLLRSRLQKYGFWKTGFWPSGRPGNIRDMGDHHVSWFWANVYQNVGNRKNWDKTGNRMKFVRDFFFSTKIRYFNHKFDDILKFTIYTAYVYS